jgi:TonB family protein
MIAIRAFAMGQLDLISSPRAHKGQPHRLRAFLASCAFHGLVLGLILGLTLLYRSHLPPLKSGSAPGSPSISLEAMIIVSPPPQPPKPPPAANDIPALKAPAPTVAATAPPREPEARPAPPEQGVPVLAVQPSKPMQSTPAKIQTPVHSMISHTATAQNPAKPATPVSSSSYAPGPNILPHPPYPLEARDLRETGIVIMNVQFDDKGNVAQAEVAQSSGVPILDSETRSFIRAHWHSATYAGQTINQPVQYSLENL